MNAPPNGLSPKSFNQYFKNHNEKHYEKKGDDYVCKTYGTTIMAVTC